MTSVFAKELLKTLKISKNNYIPPKKTKKKKNHKFKKKTKIYNPSPLVIVKKDGPEILGEEKFKNWLATVPGFLEGLTKTYDKPTKLYDYQVAHMNNTSKFRAANKSRQIGFSFSIAGESFSKSQLCDINSSVIISYNKDEASEKILVVQALYESLPLEYQKKRITDNKQSQVFKNQKGQITRVISTAQRPPRGKGFNTDVYFDEFAFWTWPDKIFTAAVPVITRGTGSITIASTPLGARGKFHDVLTDIKKFPQFSRQFIPWWHCPDLCLNIFDAFKYASKLSTIDRVNRFGNEKLKVIFETLSLDEFQQEYELAFIDENVSYFPIDLINKCVFSTDIDDFSFDEMQDAKKSSVVIENQSKSEIQVKHTKLNFFVCDSLEKFFYKIRTGEITPNLIAGFDVGRKKDKSELTVLEEIEINESTTIQIVRFVKQFDRVKFNEQKTFLRAILENLPVRRLAIDATGLGMNLAEDLHEEFKDRVHQVDMTLDWKARAAQILRIRFENMLIAIPDEEDLKRQIGSIKKKVSDTGSVRYDSDKNKDHHGDKLWSLALASTMSLVDVTSRIPLSEDYVGAKRFNYSTGKSLTTINKELIVSTEGVVYNQKISDLNGSLISMPPPIQGLLDPGGYISGSDSWSTGSLMQIRRK